MWSNPTVLEVQHWSWLMVQYKRFCIVLVLCLLSQLSVTNQDRTKTIVLTALEKEYSQQIHSKVCWVKNIPVGRWIWKSSAETNKDWCCINPARLGLDIDPAFWVDFLTQLAVFQGSYFSFTKKKKTSVKAAFFT